MLIGPLSTLSGEMSVQMILKLIICLFIVEWYKFWIQVPYQLYELQILSFIPWVVPLLSPDFF